MISGFWVIKSTEFIGGFPNKCQTNIEFVVIFIRILRYVYDQAVNKVSMKYIQKGVSKNIKPICICLFYLIFEYYTRI